MPAAPLTHVYQMVLVTLHVPDSSTGYLLGAVVGGAVIAVAGDGAFGFLLAARLVVSALLVSRVA